MKKIIKTFMLIFLLALFIGVTYASDVSTDIISPDISLDVPNDTIIRTANSPSVIEEITPTTEDVLAENMINQQKINKIDKEEKNIKEEAIPVNVDDFYDLNNTLSTASGEVILNIEQDITLQDSLTPVNINKLTIEGNGKTISGGGQHQFLYIPEGCTVFINNLTITNSTADEGGAIYNSGTLIVSNSKLYNNTANQGGAIYNYFSNLTVTHSEICNNTASNGGAIYNKEGSVNCTGSTFDMNTPENYIIYEDEGVLKIKLDKNDSFISNSGNVTIYLDDETSGFTGPLENYNVTKGHMIRLTVNGTDTTTFKDNTFILYSCNKIVTNYTQLVEAVNTAKESDEDEYCICLLPGNYNATESMTWGDARSTHKLIIEGNNITLNGKKNHQFMTIKEGYSLTLNNITLINYIAGEGGAIYNSGTLTVTNSTLNNNTATRYGGGAIENKGFLTVTNSILNYNTANYYGGAIHSTKAEYYHIVYCNFTQNRANRGAAIFSGGYLNATGNNFIENIAVINKETIYLDGWWNGVFDDNHYYSTDINLSEINISVKDDKESFHCGENVELEFNIQPTNGHYYKDFSEGINDITLYINGEEKLIGKYESYNLTYLKPGRYNINFTTCNQQSNTVTFEVIDDPVITTDKESYDYYDGINNMIQLDITDESGERGTVDISVKNATGIIELLSYHNVKDGYIIPIDTLAYALANLYEELDSPYIINVRYYSDYADSRSTEFTLNFIKERNTSIIYNILNKTEGNVQINITVIDAVNYSVIEDSSITITGDINKKTTSGIITDNTLTPGDYIINVHYNGTEEYKSSDATIDFSVEIDKDAKIEEQANTIITLNNTINELNSTIRDQAGTIIALNGTVNEFNSTIHDQVNTINTLNSTVNEFNRTIQEQNNTISVLNGTVNDFNSTIQEQANTIKELNNTVNTQSDRISDLEEQIAELTAAKNTIIKLNPITDAKYNTNITIRGILINEDLDGLFNQVVTLTIGDTIANVTTKGGLFEYNTTIKAIGEQTVMAIYAGTDKYKASNTTQIITVNRKESEISINDIATVTGNDNVTIKGIVHSIDGTPLNHVNLYLYYNGEEQHILTYKNGVFKTSFKTTTIGSQEVLIVYKGNTKYLASNATATFTTSGTKLVMFTVKPVTYRDTYTIQGKLTDYNGNIIAGADVQLTIDNETVTLTTDKNGRYTYKAQATKIGNFTVTATYNDETTATELTATKTLEVTKHETMLIVDEIADTQVGSEVTITGKLTDNNGTSYKNCYIIVKINGEQETIKTDSKGIFTYTYIPTKAGTQNVTVTYKGNSNYLGDQVKKTFEAKD